MNSTTLSSGTLSHSPGQRGTESQDSELTSVGNQTSKILNQMKSELQEQKQQDRLLRELHLKRVQSLRKELDYIKATEWRYQPIDRYILIIANYRYIMFIQVLMTNINIYRYMDRNSRN